MENSERALQLFAEGKSVNAVARTLGITWAEAKNLQPGFVSKKERKPSTRRQQAESDERWELGIKVPLERAPDIFNGFTDEEKAYLFSQLPDQKQMDAILDVLQRRMDAVCAPPKEGL